MTDKNLILYLKNKKTGGVAYAFYFCLGYFGGHRWYTGHYITAFLQLCITVYFIISLVDHDAKSAGLTLLTMLIWLFVDIFLTRGFVTKYNIKLAHKYDIDISKIANTI